MKCPECQKECLSEYTEDGLTGMCLKCLQRYPQCQESMYMAGCNLIRGHKEEYHISNRMKWLKDNKESIIYISKQI